MIITISGANFSASNIGTLSTWNVSKSIGAGAEHSIPSYVDKNSAFNYTITLKDGYTFGTYSVSMGGQTITPIVTETSMTINIASVTGAIRIEVKTINSSTGEEDKPVTPDPEQPGTGGGSGSTTITAYFEKGSLGAPDGKEIAQAGRLRTNSIPVSSINTSVTTTGTSSKFIVSCYDDAGAYIGQVATSLDKLISGSGQWMDKDTIVSKSLLSSLGAITIRVIVQSESAGTKLIIDGIEVANSDALYEEEVLLPWPFEINSIAKESGLSIAGASRARSLDGLYFNASDLGTSFTIDGGHKFIIACYGDGETNEYLGQYDAKTDTLDDACLTAAVWNDADTTVTTSNLFNKSKGIIVNKVTTDTVKQVTKVRFVTYGFSPSPSLIVDGTVVSQ